MMDQERQQAIKFVRELLNTANQISSEEFGEEPALVSLTFLDHHQYVGWKPKTVLERLQTRPPLQLTGWVFHEDETWLFLTGTEKNPTPITWTVLKSAIIERRRLNTPEVLQSFRWALAACLMVLGPKFDGLGGGG